MNVNVTSPTRTDARLERLKSALFGDMGVDGLYARSATYENVADALSAAVTALRPNNAEPFKFPPVMSRKSLQRAGYLKSFPHLLGCVSCLSGDEAHIRRAVETIGPDDDLSPALASADLVLAPAACYPVYPIAAQRGAVGEDGLVFDVSCDCFRREPSKELDRLQSFRMREFVRIGAPEQVSAFREEWMARALDFAAALGLPSRLDTASDPFFGRGGQLTAISQKQQSLKFELLIPIRSAEDPTACMSFNYHRSHFGDVWGLRDEAGETMHTGCVAFGMDRLTVALFVVHGLDIARWPQRTRETLGL